VLELAVPYSLAQLLRLIGDSATVYIMAVAGEDELAGTGLIDSVQYVFFNTALISLVSVAISVGKEKGKGNHTQVGLVFRQGLILGGLISLPFLGVSPFAEPLLVATGQPQRVARIAQDYCVSKSYGIPFIAGLTVNQQILLGISEPLATLAATVSVVSNALVSTALGYAFTLGKWGAPRLGA